MILMLAGEPKAQTCVGGLFVCSMGYKSGNTPVGDSAAVDSHLQNKWARASSKHYAC